MPKPKNSRNVLDGSADALGRIPRAYKGKVGHPLYWTYVRDLDRAIEITDIREGIAIPTGKRGEYVVSVSRPGVYVLRLKQLIKSEL